MEMGRYSLLLVAVAKNGGDCQQDCLLGVGGKVRGVKKSVSVCTLDRPLVDPRLVWAEGATTWGGTRWGVIHVG